MKSHLQLESRTCNVLLIGPLVQLWIWCIVKMSVSSCQIFTSLFSPWKIVTDEQLSTSWDLKRLCARVAKPPSHLRKCAISKLRRQEIHTQAQSLDAAWNLNCILKVDINFSTCFHISAERRQTMTKWTTRMNRLLISGGGIREVCRRHTRTHTPTSTHTHIGMHTSIAACSVRVICMHSCQQARMSEGHPANKAWVTLCDEPQASSYAQLITTLQHTHLQRHPHTHAAVCFHDFRRNFFNSHSHSNCT